MVSLSSFTYEKLISRSRIIIVELCLNLMTGCQKELFHNVHLSLSSVHSSYTLPFPTNQLLMVKEEEYSHHVIGSIILKLCVAHLLFCCYSLDCLVLLVLGDGD